MSENRKNEEAPKRLERKAVRLVHTFPEGTRSTFANHLTVQHTPEGEFHLTFFEICHPVMMGDEDAISEQLDKLEEVTAPSVARLVISGERMPKFIAALASNYESFEQEKKQSIEEAQAADDKQGKGKKHAS